MLHHQLLCAYMRRRLSNFSVCHGSACSRTLLQHDAIGNYESVPSTVLELVRRLILQTQHLHSPSGVSSSRSLWNRHTLQQTHSQLVQGSVIQTTWERFDCLNRNSC